MIPVIGLIKYVNVRGHGVGPYTLNKITLKEIIFGSTEKELLVLV